jgi:general secretion pathway protein N
VRALRPYLLLAALVFLGALVATLPATLITRALPARLALDGVSGSVWDGEAESLRLDGVALGSLHWQLDGWSLWRAQVSAELQLTRPDGHLEGQVRLRSGGQIDGEAIRFDLPLTTLHPDPKDPAWTGRIAGQVDNVRLQDGWPVALTARLTLSHLKAPNATDDLGTFALSFEPRDATPTTLLGRLQDQGGPLRVQAQLRLEHDRTYRLDGDITPRGGLSDELNRAIAFLGSPDATGRRPIGMTGSF